MSRGAQAISTPALDHVARVRGARLLAMYRTEVAILLAIVLIELGVGAMIPQALTRGNFADVAQAAAPLVIMSVGEMLVVVTGGIDLSVGSVFSLAGMVTALAMAYGLDGVSSTVCGLGVGLVVGAINGVLVTFAALAPFVVTLITYAAASSLAFIVTAGHSMPVPDQDYYLLNSGTLVPGVTNFVLYCVVLTAAVEFVLRKVVAGRWLYAIGSSSEASRLLGIRVRATRLSTYVVCSLLASFASVLSLSYISNAEGNGRIELDAAGDRRGGDRRRQPVRRDRISGRCGAGRADDHRHSERRQPYRH